MSFIKNLVMRLVFHIKNMQVLRNVLEQRVIYYGIMDFFKRTKKI